MPVILPILAVGAAAAAAGFFFAGTGKQATEASQRTSQNTQQRSFTPTRNITYSIDNSRTNISSTVSAGGNVFSSGNIRSSDEFSPNTPNTTFVPTVTNTTATPSVVQTQRKTTDSVGSILPILLIGGGAYFFLTQRKK